VLNRALSEVAGTRQSDERHFTVGRWRRHSSTWRVVSGWRSVNSWRSATTKRSSWSQWIVNSKHIFVRQHLLACRSILLACIA